MLERIFLLEASAAAALLTYAILSERGRKSRYLGLITRAERDAGIYEELLGRKPLVVSSLAARIPGRLGLAISASSVVAITLIAYQAVHTSEAQLTLVIPGVTIKGLYSIVAIVLAIPYAVIAHEAAHAFAAILRGKRPKSTGLVALGPFLLAYVGFEDEDLDPSIASAGVAANLLLAALSLAAMYALSFLLAGHSAGVLITSGPAAGSVVVAVNGTRVRDVSEFLSVRQSLPAGSVVDLALSDGSHLSLVKGSVRLGISNRYFGGPAGVLTAFAIAYILRTFVINLSLGLINALPVFGLDGSRVRYYYLTKRLKNEGAAFAALVSLSLYSILAILLALSPRRRNRPGATRPF